MIAISKTYHDITIHLDGGTFKNCKFRNCRLVYCGLQGVMFDGCDFGEGVTWNFDGPARNIATFLTALYAMVATELIENFFQKIRGKPPGSGAAPTYH